MDFFSWIIGWISTWLVLSSVTMALFVLFGDVFLTWIIRQTASRYIDPTFKISWSFWLGKFRVQELKLTSTTLKLINGFLPLPADIQAISLGNFLFQFPFLFFCCGITGVAYHGIQIKKFEFDLVWQSIEKWKLKNNECHERFQKDIEAAALARIAQVNAWTQTIDQKVKELIKLKDGTKNADTLKDAAIITSGKTPFWKLLLDKVINSFEYSMKDIHIGMHWGLQQSLGFDIASFHLQKGANLQNEPNHLVILRKLDLNEFSFFINTSAEEIGVLAAPPQYVIPPMSFQMDFIMPPIMQSLMAPTFADERNVEVKICFANIIFMIRPLQINALMYMLQPLYTYWKWMELAAKKDALKCITCDSEEEKKYKRMYRDQITFMEETGFARRMISTRFDPETKSRMEFLDHFEKQALGRKLLQLRIEAHNWLNEIPSAGIPALGVSKKDKYEADLDQFLIQPANSYLSKEEKEQVEAQSANQPDMLHNVQVSLTIGHFSFLPVKDNDSRDPILDIFADQLSISISQNLTCGSSSSNATDDAQSFQSVITLQRFGILDKIEESSKNVFKSILDHNPGSDVAFFLSFDMLLSGHMDLQLRLADFSFLLILDPFIELMHTFAECGAIEENEEDQDATNEDGDDDELSSLTDIQQQNGPSIIYAKDLPQPYSPLLLYGMSLAATIEISGAEFCLLGDPSKIDGHVLAMTSNVKLLITSTQLYESIELELVDVALQPCKIQIEPDAIRLEISGLRSILELEGDGVDISLNYVSRMEEIENITDQANDKHQTNDDDDDSPSDLITSDTTKRWKRIQKTAIKKKLSDPSLDLDHFPMSKTELAATSSRLFTRPSQIRFGDAQANRFIDLHVSDLGINFSKDDIAVLLNISSRIVESFEEDATVAENKRREAEEVFARKKERETLKHAEKLKKEFRRLDSDGGGTLDTTEVEQLLRNVMKDSILTKGEFEATLSTFMKIVDEDGSGEISFDEFVSAFDPEEIHYSAQHSGTATLLAREYNNPNFKRSAVPSTTIGENGSLADTLNLANKLALTFFWKKYTEETGTTLTSLGDQSPLVVQKKMIRVFQNYEYAQEAWNRLVNPALTIPAQQSPWLITRNMVIEGRTNVINELLSSISLSSDAAVKSEIIKLGTPLYVHTSVTTRMGGLYLRIIDMLLPEGTPSLEFVTEDIVLKANFSIWEGLDEWNEDDARKSELQENAGSSQFGFTIYGKYYNSHVRQVEPYLEPFRGNLIMTKDQSSKLCIRYESDRYLHLNITAALMDTIQSDIKAFSSVNSEADICDDNKRRDHIDELGGIFWLKNNCGNEVAYWVVTQNNAKNDTAQVSFVASPPNLVENEGYHPCIMEDQTEMMKAQLAQNLKEKEMRAAFRKADIDGSGELGAEEVRLVLQEVLTKTDLSPEEVDEQLKDFMALADTDHSGEVSWTEFQLAMSKTHFHSERTLTLQVEGYEPIPNIPIDILGSRCVYDLVPELDPPLTGQETISELYERGKTLYLKSSPSPVDLSQAYMLFEKVKQAAPGYEWIESYYEDCRQNYSPQQIALHLDYDPKLGMLVLVSSTVRITNGTENVTEVKLFDTANSDAISNCNPVQINGEQYYSLKPSDHIEIPLELIEVGQFAIRQVGEEEWSDRQGISIHQQQEQIKPRKQGKLKRLQSSDDSYTVLVDGKERSWPTELTIDGQPIDIVETGTLSHEKSLWAIAVRPQFVFKNVLPCQIEYAFVQDPNVSEDHGSYLATEDSLSSIRKENGKKKKKAYSSSEIESWFEHVSSVNSRAGIISSGKFVQISGLNLSEPGFMKFRVLPSTSDTSLSQPATSTSEIDAGQAQKGWSQPFEIQLQNKMKNFHNYSFHITVSSGLILSFAQSWIPGSARSMAIYAPYWIMNKSGLDLRYKISKGVMLNTEEHRAYFEANSKTVPFLVHAPENKAKLAIKPYASTPLKWDWNTDTNDSISASVDEENALTVADEHSSGRMVKKYLPHFEKNLPWSNSCDMHQVGVVDEFEAGTSSFVLAFEVTVAPGQFNLSKVVTIYPRYVVRNVVPRALHLLPAHIEKQKERHKETSSRAQKHQKPFVTLGRDQTLLIYRFSGSERKKRGIYLRDTNLVHDLTSGPQNEPWMPYVTLSDSSNSAHSTSFRWSKGVMGPGPLIKSTVQSLGTSIFTSLEDASTFPEFRIENRSTNLSIKYSQVGVLRAIETVLPPMSWHSFAWQNPNVDEVRLKLFIGKSRKPLTVNIMQVAILGPVSADNAESQTLFGEVYLDGPTRVLAFGNTDQYHVSRQEQLISASNTSSSSWVSLYDMSIDISLYGFGLTIVDAQPQEVMNITAERIHTESLPGSHAITFTIHHVQIDDMTVDALYPVVFCPLDSGFNSEKKEAWRITDAEDPFFRFVVESTPSTGIPIFNQFHLYLGSMAMKLNLDYLLLIADVVFRFLPPESEKSQIQSGISMKSDLILKHLAKPEVLGNNTGSLLYFKNLFLSSFEFHLTFNSNPDKAGSGLSAILGDTLGSLIGGFAHITPDFKFKLIRYENQFFYTSDLIWEIIYAIVFAVIKQFYMIVGSVEILGDPAGLVQDITGGVSLAIRQTKRDLKGTSEKKGQGAVTLAQTIIGAPMGALSKSTNAMGDMLKQATYFEDQEEDEAPRHIGEGLVHGGMVLGKSLMYGVTGLVTKPIEGAKEEGFKGFGKGLGKGTIRFIASPFVGSLGIIEKLTQSVENTTHLGDTVYYEGTRRPARQIHSGTALKSLEDSNIISEIEFYVAKVTGLPSSGSKKFSNMTTRIKVRLYDAAASPRPVEEDRHHHHPCQDKVVDTFKTSKRRHTSSPEWHESKLFSVRSTNLYFVIELEQKRKPLKSRVLARLELSGDRVYRDFEQIPVELFLNPVSRKKLANRDVHVGSAFADCISAAGVRIEDSQELEAICQQEMHVVPMTSEVEELKDVQLHFTIRYINDMRR